MGFKPWGNLSVLLLAGAALVGCNNTPQKDKSLGAGPKVGDASIVKGQTNMPGPKFPSNTNGPSQAYPQPGANPNPLADISPKSPWPPTPGSSPAPFNSSFAPAGGPLPRDPFPPLPRDIAPLGGNGGGRPGNITPPANPLPPIPNVNSPIGGTIYNSPAPYQPATPFATEPRNPNPQIPSSGGTGIPTMPQDFPKN